MLDEVKISMRISHNMLDTDIQHDIDACLSDLRRAGIEPYEKDSRGYRKDSSGDRIIRSDALIHKAVKLYCKWQCNYQGEGERYQSNYEDLRDAMSLAGDYREG